MQRGVYFLKKILVIFLSLLLVLLPFSVTAKPSPPNYLEGLTWTKVYSATIKETNGLYVEATDLKHTYSTPAINIAPALKQTFYDHNMNAFVTVKISGKIRATFKNGASNNHSLHLVIRAKTNLNNSKSWEQS